MLNPLAQILSITKIRPHPNADLLEIAQVLGWEAIVKKGEYKEGDIIAFLFPDASLPDKPCFSFYNSKSNRIKTIKLRGFMSQGIVENLEKIGYSGPIEIGKDIHEELGITKWEAPQPQDLSAAGVYGFGIPKTDESNYQNFRDLPYGEICDVTLKIDGQSWSALCKLGLDESNMPILEAAAIGGRSFLFKENVENNYKTNEKKYNVLKKLSEYCMNNNISLCIRGEQYGLGIQKGDHNPHSKLPLNLAFFSTWLIDSRQYATKGHPLYIFDLAPKLGLPTVPVLEKDVVLTPELIKKYDSELTKVNGVPFEGVVINWKGGSFKVINKDYDSKKK